MNKQDPFSCNERPCQNLKTIFSKIGAQYGETAFEKMGMNLTNFVGAIVWY